MSLSDRGPAANDARPPEGDISRLLAARAAGAAPEDPGLWQLVYGELRRIARGLLARERPGHTLDATALVHEVWLQVGEGIYEGKARRAEVLAYAARAMRSLLVDHARRKNSRKRGGDVARITLREDLDGRGSVQADMVELDDALSRLAELDPELGRIAELHLFAGLDQAEVAAVVGLPLRTLQRRWRVALTWLRREFTP